MFCNYCIGRTGDVSVAQLMGSMERSPLSFFENWKKKWTNMGEKYRYCICPWIKYSSIISFKMLFLEYLREKTPKSLLRGHSFMCWYVVDEMLVEVSLFWESSNALWNSWLHSCIWCSLLTNKLAFKSCLQCTRQPFVPFHKPIRYGVVSRFCM